MIRTAKAKQLCTKDEYELFALSRARTVKTLTAKELHNRVKRSRKARDKYGALASKQQREARGKQVPKGRRPSQSSQRTAQKHQLFAETLTRYEARLSELQQLESAAPVKKKTAAKKKSATKKKSASKQVKKSTKKAREKPTAKKANTAKKTVTKGTKQTTIPRKKQAAAKKAPKRKKKPTSVASLPTNPKPDKRKRKPATKTKSGTALRQSAKLSGQTRKRKHLSAQSKRNQSRRDSR